MSKKIENREQWEIEHSSLAKKLDNKEILTYDLCREYACLDIEKKLTHIDTSGKSVIELPKGTDFHFIGRVDTSNSWNNPILYYESFKERSFISFSTINNANISHYYGRVFFVYNILAKDIAHIFPIDSYTNIHAESEEDLTNLPSLWLTLKELEDLTLEMGVYNQVTCKTKRDDKILKPFATISFCGFNPNDKEPPEEVAKRFSIPCIKVYPNNNAINYGDDIYCDDSTFDTIVKKMYTFYNLGDPSEYFC